MLRAALLALSLLIPSAAFAEGRTMIVLDASGSMWGQIEGRTKVEIAREVLASVLGQVPADTELGLVAYGHRREGDCGDIEVVVEAAPGTAGAIVDFANSTRFQGKTPLTDAVRVAAEAIGSADAKATVILVTDGIETCNADPCALGAELEAGSVDFTAHVVGFGLSEEEGRAVACLAEATGGLYLPASDAAQLTDALTRTVVAEPEPAPAPPPEPEPVALEHNLIATASLAEGGEPFEADIFWEIYPVTGGEPAADSLDYTYNATYRLGAPEGAYLLRAKIGEVTREERISLKADALTEVHFVLNAAVVTLVGLRAEGGEQDDSIYVEIAQGELNDYGYGRVRTVMPAGELVLKGSQGGAEATKTIAAGAGDQIEETIVVGSGIAAVSAVYAPGGPPVEGAEIYFEIFSAAQKIDGSRESFAYTYGSGQLDVPAGDYVLFGRIGEAEALSEPFAVAAGGRTEVQIVMNAGVAFISAPDAARLNIFGEAKDIQGNRAEFGYSFGAEYQTTLPAGRYVVAVGYDSDRAPQEAAFEVKAGERVEVSVP
jgi:Ca-activated chloride channel family protein